MDPRPLLSAKPVLVVEDDDAIADLVATNLATAGLRAHRVRTGRAALLEVERGEHALIILDVGLPGLDGFDVLRSVRRLRATPVLMLTARSDLDDRVMGLELGADDYLTKPFSPIELVARVRAVLRRTEPHDSHAVVELDDLMLDPTRREARVQGRALLLTPLEFDLLYVLARSPGSTMSRDALTRQLWGPERTVDSRAVDNLVRRIRSKLGSEPDTHARLLTVWGVGYRLERSA